MNDPTRHVPRRWLAMPIPIEADGFTELVLDPDDSAGRRGHVAALEPGQGPLGQVVVGGPELNFYRGNRAIVWKPCGMTPWAVQVPRWTVDGASLFWAVSCD